MQSEPKDESQQRGTATGSEKTSVQQGCSNADPSSSVRDAGEDDGPGTRADCSGKQKTAEEWNSDGRDEAVTWFDPDVQLEMLLDVGTKYNPHVLPDDEDGVDSVAET
ncbi:hypothetical protein OC834_003575 [Tilletia horrida]|nr:hypothetical protein OC834_003575 [Tilletia horrida]